MQFFLGFNLGEQYFFLEFYTVNGLLLFFCQSNEIIKDRFFQVQGIFGLL